MDLIKNVLPSFALIKKDELIHSEFWTRCTVFSRLTSCTYCTKPRSGFVLSIERASRMALPSIYSMPWPDCSFVIFKLLPMMTFYHTSNHSTTALRRLAPFLEFITACAQKNNSKKRTKRRTTWWKVVIPCGHLQHQSSSPWIASVRTLYLYLFILSMF